MFGFDGYVQLSQIGLNTNLDVVFCQKCVREGKPTILSGNCRHTFGKYIVIVILSEGALLRIKISLIPANTLSLSLVWGSIVKNQNLPDIQTLTRLWSTLWCHHPNWKENWEVVAHRYAIFGSLNIILSTSAPPQFEFPRRVEIYLTSGLLLFGSPSEALAPAKWNKENITLCFLEKNNDDCIFLTFGQSSAGGGGTDWWFQTTTILARDSTSPRVWITWEVGILSILRTFFLQNWRLWWKSFKTEPCDKNPSKGLMKNLKEAGCRWGWYFFFYIYFEGDIDEVVMMRPRG